jgi:PAS domain S-box-containing protein
MTSRDDSVAEQLTVATLPSLSDAARLEALRRTMLLDTPADPAFDRLTRLATRLLHVPVALVSLVDQERQFLKSAVGLPEPWASERETPLSHSFCQHVVASGKPLIIADARQDLLLCDNLAIVDLQVTAYAGIPLITADGHAIGSFCAIDTETRIWTEDDVALLQDLAAAAMTEIELRVATVEAQMRADEAERERREKTMLLESIGDAFMRREFVLETSKIGEWELDLLTGKTQRTFRHDQCFGATEPLADWSYEIFLSYVYPDDRAEVDRRFREAIYEHKEWDFVCRVLWADTSVHWIHAKGDFYRDAGEQLSRMVGIVIDITEQKEVEEALRASEARLQAVTDLVPDLLWSNGPDGGTEWYNRRWHEYTGQPLAEARGYGWLDVIHPDDRDGSLRNFLRAIEGGEALRQEHRIRRADGEYRWFLVQAAVLKDEAGTIVRWYGAATDIHNEREALIVAQAAQAEAEAALRARDDFMSMLSHDLKQPLGVIQAYAGMARRRLGRSDTDMIARTGDSLLKIEAAAQRMTHFINGLLDVSRLAAGEVLALESSPTDLVALVQHVVAEQQQTTERHRLHVSVLVPELVGMYDAPRLERVLVNLLGNAIKYSPEGGTITVLVMAETEGAERWSVLEVRDQGLGIPAADLPYVFDRFRRGTNVMGEISGSGIGLASALQIAKQHGGTISVESVEGQGTTFTVRLPLTETGPRDRTSS